ncbi:MAG: HAD family hydrolase [Rikenellaceae bacterium]|nr:HAD family hydrolase [Rikenellaceae bacterium]
MIRFAIFDLDGTLLNTIDDLAISVNYSLEKCGFPAHPVEAYKKFVGNGINNLFLRALPEGEKSDANIERMRMHFLPYYAENGTKHTRPYEGIPEILKTLQDKGIKIAVASNKYQEATEKIIANYFPDTDFCAILGQREGIPVKPDPTIVFDILETAGIPAEDTIYIGDSGVDMQTAANSSLTSIGVTWGFRDEDELRSNGAVHIVKEPTAIIGIIENEYQC